MTENKENIDQIAADGIQAVKPDPIETLTTLVKGMSKQLNQLNGLEGRLKEKFDKIDKKLKAVNRLEKRIKDLESDSRTDKAMLRAAQQMGFGFREKTPYELKGNAAIEDIKEYY